jgi:hypothetical protein
MGLFPKSSEGSVNNLPEERRQVRNVGEIKHARRSLTKKALAIVGAGALGVLFLTQTPPGRAIADLMSHWDEDIPSQPQPPIQEDNITLQTDNPQNPSK